MNSRLSYSLAVLLFLLICGLSYTPISNAEGRVYYAKLELGNIQVNLGLIDAYERKLSKALGSTVEISDQDNIEHDIWISSESAIRNKQLANWSRSSYSLDYIPTFLEISLAQPKPQVGITGQTRGPYQLIADIQLQDIQDSAAAIRLLNSGRVDKVISHSNNAHQYANQPLLVVKELNNSTALFVSFRDKRLLDRYNKNIFTANTNSFVDINEMALPEVSSDNTIIWQLFFKYFDENLNKLVLLDADKEATLWYQSKLPQFNLAQAFGTVADGFDAMRKQPNVCLLNIFKTEERTAFAHFTEPSVAYLNERLYALDNSEFGMKLAASTSDNTVDLNQAAALAAYSYESRNIAIDSRYLSRFPTSLAELMEERAAQFINSQPWRKDTLINQLVQQEIAGFIDLPNMVEEDLAKLESGAQITSYSIEGLAPFRVGYVACSKSPQGEAVIEQINQVLADESNRIALAEIYAKHFDKNTKATAQKAFIDMQGK